MKKLLTILTISALILSSTFAATERKEIIINGLVEESLYSFDLIYSGEPVNSENTILNEKQFNLANTDIQETEIFTLQRSPGNLNKNLEISVDITTDAFIGDINGNEIETTIIPEIRLLNVNSNNYEEIKYTQTENKNITTFDIIIPFGANSNADVEIASFILTVTGKDSTDAGIYTSNVLINYTYDQNR